MRVIGILVTAEHQSPEEEEEEDSLAVLQSASHSLFI